MFLDALFNSEQTVRQPEEQAKVDNEAQGLALYHYNSCPYCIMTRRAIHRLNVSIELRDILQDFEHRTVLAAGGGRTTVPCLRIEEEGSVRWLYESRDIAAYLEQRFGDD